MLWDRGSWTPLVDPGLALKKGELKFTLQGEKLVRQVGARQDQGRRPQGVAPGQGQGRARAVGRRARHRERAPGERRLAGAASPRWPPSATACGTRRRSGPDGKVDPGGAAEGEGGARLRLADLAGAVRGAVPRTQPLALAMVVEAPARRRRVAARDQARRLPHRGSDRGRRGAARLAQRQGLDEGVPAGRPRDRPAARRHGAPRRRGRRGAAERGDQLPGAAAASRRPACRSSTSPSTCCTSTAGTSRRPAGGPQGGAAASPGTARRPLCASAITCAGRAARSSRRHARRASRAS